jgi:hypothetical protein
VRKAACSAVSSLPQWQQTSGAKMFLLRSRSYYFDENKIKITTGNFPVNIKHKAFSSRKRNQQI